MSEAQVAQTQMSFPAEMVFGFRKDKKTGEKRQDIKIEAQVPTNAALIQYLGKPESAESVLIFEAVKELIRGVGLSMVKADVNLTSSNFPVSKLSWTEIANMPKADRRSSSLSEEDWTAFAELYLAVMPALVNRTEKQVANALQLLMAKLTPVKTDKSTLKTLQGYLGKFMEHQDAGEHAGVLEFLLNRLDNYLKADDISEIKNNI